MARRARELARSHERDLGVEIVAFDEMVYVPALARHVHAPEVPRGAETKSLSGTELRRRLRDGGEIPDWFTTPAVVRELRKRRVDVVQVDDKDNKVRIWIDESNEGGK